MKTFTKAMMLLLTFSLSNNAMAQSFLKKLSKATQEETDTVTSTESSNKTNSNGSIDVKALLDEKISFTAMKVYVTDEATGDTVKNEDGTYKISYRIIDAKGNVCSPTKAKEIVDNRTKEVTKILKYFVTDHTPALNALKEVYITPFTDLMLSLSTDEIKEIGKLNKELQAYKKTISAYEKTFNEEGEIIDATVDLSDIDGIDFTNIGSMAKTSQDIMKELENEEDAGSLGYIDF